jgi:hypothetical protein
MISENIDTVVRADVTVTPGSPSAQPSGPNATPSSPLPVLTSSPDYSSNHSAKASSDNNSEELSADDRPRRAARLDGLVVPC